MTTAPYVELRFNPTDLRPHDLPKSGQFLGSPADALEASLAVTRTAVIKQARADLRGIASPTHAQMLRILDLAWQGVFWKFRKISAPIMADAYLHAYRDADAGDVPVSVIYDLADKHAEKIGDYFHETSRAGLADGFNTLVNRRIPAKAAADIVLDAYGLSPRQMRAFVSASQFSTPVSDVMPRSVKARARAYIDKAFTSRTRKLSRQEEHNIDEQAKQFAWMWMQDKGRLPLHAEKLWITARDERVCPICGPLHGQKVRVGERFVTKDGEFWTPGLHPNCRCVVRLLEHRFSIGKAATALADDDWDPKEHPRDKVGRFARGATIDVDSEFDRIVDQQILKQPATHPKYSAVGRTHDADLAMLFHDVVQGATWEAPTVVRSGYRAKPAPPKPTITPIQIEATRISNQIISVKGQTLLAEKLTTRLQATAKPETKPKTLPETKTKPARRTLGTTAYAVVTSDQFVEGSPGKIDVDELIFETDAEAASKKATQLIAGQISDAVGNIVKMGSKVDPLTHDLLKPTRKQVREIVEWYAAAEPRMHLVDEFYKDPVDTAIAVPVHELGGGRAYDPHTGQPLTKNMLMSHIGALYEIDRIPFDAVIIKVNEGYDGKTFPYEEGSTVDAFKLGGRFRVKPLSKDSAEIEGVHATIFEIEPILDDE